MIYDRYKDLHLEGNKVFPIKRYYKTMNMSLRHVANMRHTFARRLRLRRAYPWKPSARCWDINGSPRPKITNDKIGQDMAALSERLDSVFKIAQ